MRLSPSKLALLLLLGCSLSGASCPGKPPPSCPAPPATLSVPQSFHPTGGPASITLEWQYPLGFEACQVQRFEVVRFETDVAHAFLPGPISEFSVLPAEDPGALSLVDADVQAGELYYYWVYAIDTLDRRSPDPDLDFSHYGGPLYPPHAKLSAIANPPVLATTAGDGTATLSWQLASDANVLGYHIYRGIVPWQFYPNFSNGTLVATVSAPDQATLTLTGLQNGVGSYYRVTAYTASSESDAASANPVYIVPTLPTEGPPPAPLDFSVVPLSALHVRLSWDPGLAVQYADFDGYRLTREGPPGQTRTFEIAKTATSTDLPLRPGESFTFTLRSRDTDGNESEEAGPLSIELPAFALKDKVLVLYNANFGDGDGDGVNDSLEVAEFYRAKRQISLDRVLPIAASVSRRYPDSQAGWAKFYDEILVPVRTKISELGIDNVHYIVTMYGMPLFGGHNSNGWVTPYAHYLEVPFAMTQTAPLGNSYLPCDSFRLGGPRSGPMLTSVLADPAPQSVNAIDAAQPDDTMLFDHSFKRGATRSGGCGSPADMFIVTHVDGFSVLHAKEMVEKSLYAEAYLSPDSYHGDAYFDRGSLATLGTAVAGDWNNDGDSDDSTLDGNGDDDDLTLAQIQAAYPANVIDLNWAFLRLLLLERGFSGRTEVTPASVGDSGSLWSDGTAATTGPEHPVQWYLGTFNNFRYNDVWKWAVGAVALDRGSYTLWHPKEPVGILEDWTGNDAEGAQVSPSFGPGALYRGVSAYGGSTAECGDCVIGDVMIGLLLEGFPFADAYGRARLPSAFGYGFGDPLYRPFPPGKVALLDDVPPPVPQTTVVDDSTSGVAPRARIRWSIDPPEVAPDVARATLHYGPTPDLGSVVEAEDASLEGFHLGGEFLLDGLVAGQTTYYRVTVVDPAGNTNESALASFALQLPGNLLQNGELESDADEDGLPDSWTASGSPVFFPPNAARNGSFERDADANGYPDGWSENGAYSTDGAESYAGSAAYRTSGAPITLSSAGAPLSGNGQEFSLSGWIRRADAASDSQITVSVRFEDASGQSPPDQRVTRVYGFNAGGLTPPQIGSQWQPFRVRGRVPGGAASLADVVLGHSEAIPGRTGGDVWYDDIRLLIENPNAWGGYGSVGVRDDFDFVSQAVPVVEGQSYVLSLQVRGSDASQGKKPRIVLEWRDAAGDPLSSEAIPVNGVGNSAWESVSQGLVAPLGATTLEISLKGASGASEIFWFDHVELR